jgi:glycine/D-amino acid oxidase-like deaminating enzyme
MNVSALHGRLLGDETAGAEFRARAYHHAVSLYRQQSAFRPTGALQLALTEKELAKLQRIRQVYRACGYDDSDDSAETLERSQWLAYCAPDALDAVFATKALGGLFFTDAGVVDLPQMSKDLFDHSAISLHHTAAEPGPDQPWIIACASASRHYGMGIPLEIGDVWGQLDWIEPTSATVPVPIVGNGYVIPTGSKADGWVIGSSYEQRPWASAEATRSNVEANRRFIGDDSVTSIQHKRAARCVSSDRDPVIGRLGETRWVTTAHGSSGTSTAPLAASIIASDILGWVAPVSQRGLNAVDPKRFISRQARRGVKVVGPQQA